MQRRFHVSPAEKRNETIDRCPPIKSRGIYTLQGISTRFRASKSTSSLAFGFQKLNTLNTKDTEKPESATRERGRDRSRSSYFCIPVTGRKRRTFTVRALAPALCVPPSGGYPKLFD